MVTKGPQCTDGVLLIAVGEPVHRQLVGHRGRGRVLWRLGVQALLPSADTSTSRRQPFNVPVTATPLQVPLIAVTQLLLELLKPHAQQNGIVWYSRV